MATHSVLMKHVAPALGVVVACMLFASPLKAVKGVRQSRQLGVSTADTSTEGCTSAGVDATQQHAVEAATSAAVDSQRPHALTVRVRHAPRQPPL